MENKLKPWPENWMLHLMYSFKSYFRVEGDDNLDISLHSISPMTSILNVNDIAIDNSVLRAGFVLKEKLYAMAAFRSDSLKINIVLFAKTTNHWRNIFINSYEEKTPIDVIKDIENGIWKDYWDNNNGGDEEPISPMSPIDSELIFA